jgi:hypothetical protein
MHPGLVGVDMSLEEVGCAKDVVVHEEDDVTAGRSESSVTRLRGSAVDLANHLEVYVIWHLKCF